MTVPFRACLFPLLLAIPALSFAVRYDAPQSLVDDLEQATVGQVIDWPNPSIYFLTPFNAFPTRFVSTGGDLIYSDDPEESTGQGILYQADVGATFCRVYLYHTNKTSTPSRFSIVLENTGSETATVTPDRRVVPTPTGDYSGQGRQTVRDFYEFNPLNVLPSFTIPPGGTALLDPELDSTTVTTNQLMGSIHDFTTDHPLKVSTVMINNNGNTLYLYDSLSMLTDDSHEREGTFTQDTMRTISDTINYSTSEGCRTFIIGSATATGYDPPAEGTDQVSNTATSLGGNYGIDYQMSLNIINDAGKKLAILLNPRGGDYAGYIRSTYNHATLGTIVPQDTYFIPPTTKAAVCALLDPRAQSTPFNLEFMPAGASSLSVHILLVPYGETENTVSPSSWVLY